MGDEDKSAFEGMFREHYPAVLSYALARAAPHIAADATATTFLVAWRRWADVPGTPLGWLLGVTRKTLADERRSHDRQQALGLRMIDTRHTATVADDDPADTVIERDAARAALAALSPDDAETLCLIAWDGLSNSQAAQVLGCSTAGFAVRLHRARRRFEAALAAVDTATTTGGETTQDSRNADLIPAQEAS